MIKIIKRIIQDDPSFAWLNEQKERVALLFSQNLRSMLDGKAFVIVTDENSEWYEKYFLQKINENTSERPFLPFYSLKNLYSNFANLKSKDEILLVDDLLNLTFANGFIYFYIGAKNSPRFELIRNNENTFLWILGENSDESLFSIGGSGVDLDIKLLKIYEIFDKSVNVSLFDEAIL